MDAETKSTTRGRIVVALLTITFGITGIYFLMTRDGHIVALSAVGMAIGGRAGSLLAHNKGFVFGGVIGFLAPWIYLPLWIIFDLPPASNLDL